MKQNIASKDIIQFWHDGWKDAFDKRKKEISKISHFEKIFYETAIAVSFDSKEKFGVFLRYQFEGLQRKFVRLVDEILSGDIPNHLNVDSDITVDEKILTLLGESNTKVNRILSYEKKQETVYQVFFPRKEFFIQLWQDYDMEQGVLHQLQHHGAGGFFDAWMKAICVIHSNNSDLKQLQKDIASFSIDKRDKRFRYFVVKVFQDEKNIKNILHTLFSSTGRNHLVDTYFQMIHDARVAKKDTLLQLSYYATRQQARTYRKFDKTPEQ